jgi:hypothetical protein
MVAVTAMVGALVGASAAPANAAEPFSITTQTDASVLAQSFAGTGGVISNATLVAAGGQAASFQGGEGPVGIRTGIALSSGDADGMAVSGGSTSENKGGAGDAALSGLIGGLATFDAAVLRFDIVPTGSTLSFDYVYASDEETSFHDPFGLFVNGVNCARFPGTQDVITNANLLKPANSSYRIDNGAARGLNMSRLTTVLTCEVAVEPGVVNHIKIAVADNGDRILNSAVFIAPHNVKGQTSISYTGVTTAVVGDGAVELGADLTDSAGQALVGQEVTFTLGTQTAVAVTDSLGHATASLALSQPAGSVSVGAAFAGTYDYDASSAQTNFEITKMQTGTTLSVSPSPSAWAEAATLTATVTGPADTTPAGDVEFFVDGVSAGAVTLVAGAAVLDILDLAVGPHELTATYEGAQEFASSTSDAVTHSVTKAATTTTLSSAPDGPVTGSPVTLTATVDGAPDAVPTGSVTFTDGDVVLGTVVLDADGVAVLELDSLDAGPHAVTATYEGDADFDGSASAPSDLSVGKRSTTVSLAQSVSTTAFGTAFDLTATVDSTRAATGEVTFYAGTTLLGSATLVNGVATLTSAGLHAGDHSLTAVYGGDARTGSATSDAIVHTVAKAATTTTLTFSPTNVRPHRRSGDADRGREAQRGHGSVTFTRGTTVLGSAALTGGTARLVVTTLPAGTSVVVASYGGSADFAGSSSAGSSIVVRSPAWSSAAQVEAAPGTTQAWNTRTTTGTFGGTQAVEGSAGAAATYAFSGTALTYWFSTGPRGGVANLYVDGTFVRSVTMYSSVVKVRQSVRLSGLRTGSHSLKIVLARHDSTTLAVREVTVGAFSAATTCGTGCDVTPTLAMRWAEGLNAIASGGAYRFSRAAGATTTVKFTGTGVSVSRIVGPQQGKFAVYVDGVSRGIVNGYAAKNAMTSSATTITGLTRGSHTLVIKVLGQAGSTSVPTSINVCLDRVSVLQ